MPEALRSAIAKGDALGLPALTSWGNTAHVNVRAGAEKARVLQESLLANPVRARMTTLLEPHPSAENEHELARLEHIADTLASMHRDPDLREALRAIIEFERCFRLVLMAVQRLLCQCQRQEPFAVELASTEKEDPPLRRSGWAAAGRSGTAARERGAMIGLSAPAAISGDGGRRGRCERVRFTTRPANERG